MLTRTAAVRGVSLVPGLIQFVVYMDTLGHMTRSHPYEQEINLMPQSWKTLLR
jgi:hypothetical protein